MSDHDIDPKLAAALNELKAVPPRDNSAAARGRARFLIQITEMTKPISRGGLLRLIRCKNLTRKERLLMNAIISSIIAAALLFGGATGTVYASQDALPNDMLYSVKLLSEDVRLQLTSDSQTEIDLLMQMVQTRVQESAALQEQGIDVPPRVANRLEQHVQQALQLAAGMDEADIPGALLRIHTELQNSERIMTALRTQATGESSQIMAQTCTKLQEHIRMVENGLSDPQGFQNAVGAGMYGISDDSGSSGNGAGNNGPQGTASPEDGSTQSGSQGPKGTHTPQGQQGSPGGQGQGGPNN